MALFPRAICFDWAEVNEALGLPWPATSWREEVPAFSNDTHREIDAGYWLIIMHKWSWEGFEGAPHLPGFQSVEHYRVGDKTDVFVMQPL